MRSVCWRSGPLKQLWFLWCSREEDGSCSHGPMAKAAAAMVQWPKVTTTMSELYAWAKSLEEGDGMKQLKALDLLIYRWSAAFQTLSEDDLHILQSKCDEFVGLPKDVYRDPRHGKFHGLSSTWVAAGNRNLAILARALIPSFTAASNANTVGSLLEVVTWPRSSLLFMSLFS